jgi:hypothetical protein
MERLVRLAPVTWSALERIARDEDRSVGDILRDAVERDLYRRTRAKKAVRPDERLIAPLRALLADDLAYAASWPELAARLARKGYALIESGPGLVLAAQPSGQRLCKASDLGYSHSRLASRLGSPFPSHAHAHIVARSAARPHGF